jgi:hypothetical protein
MSASSGVGLLCEAGFAGDVSLAGWGAGFPQAEIKTASKRQQDAMRFLWKSICVFMRTKGCWQDSGGQRWAEVTK